MRVCHLPVVRQRITLVYLETEYGQRGQEVVEDVGLDVFVAGPGGVVGENVDLEGESLIGHGFEVADQEGQSLVHVFMAT